MTLARPELSVVVPLYNEQDNLLPLYEAVVEALAAERIGFQIVLVDDGSRDGTAALGAHLARRDPRVCFIKLRRNFGQTTAIAVGIRQSSGRLVATIDGDGQNDPRDIPEMLARLREGHDLVAGWRRRRQDATLRVLPSKVANWMIRRFLGTGVKDTGCSLKVYRGDLIRNVPLYADMHRFIPTLASLAGARMAQMPVRHRPRQFGRSNYGFSRIFKVCLDLISLRFLLSFTGRPYAWMLSVAAPSLVVGNAFVLLGLWRHTMELSYVVALGIGVLLLSIPVFTVTWGLVGLLIAQTGGQSLQHFALVATRLTQPDHES